MTTWPADTELQGELTEASNHSQGIGKLTHYLPIYDSTIDRTKPVHMLKIGSFYTDSVRMWQEYLHPDSHIVGVDTNAKLLKIANPKGIHARIAGEEESEDFLKEVATEFGPFDIIVDTGNHTSSHMVESFRCLFANFLSDEGVYIVEDVFCDYRKFYRDSRTSFIDFVRALIDAMHAHYQVTTSDTNFQLGHADRIPEVLVPAITPILGAIEIYDSLVVVRRAARGLTRGTHRT
ncbi:class I SAM-dependent methyltransferase [Mycobacterium sp. pR1184]|uniref:class I SAM-dependent methyltransferase n=1 Tax=Mycobacterium sp. pR1184 TaxID=3238981 RepID=UPI00351B5AE5